MMPITIGSLVVAALAVVWALWERADNHRTTRAILRQSFDSMHEKDREIDALKRRTASLATDNIRLLNRRDALQAEKRRILEDVADRDQQIAALRAANARAAEVARRLRGML